MYIDFCYPARIIFLPGIQDMTLPLLHYCFKWLQYGNQKAIVPSINTY